MKLIAGASSELASGGPKALTNDCIEWDVVVVSEAPAQAPR